MYRICGKVASRQPNKKSKAKTSSHHGRLFGFVKRSITSMQLVYDSETATDDAKALAAKLEGQLTLLYHKLEKRRP